MITSNNMFQIVLNNKQKLIMYHQICQLLPNKTKENQEKFSYLYQLQETLLEREE